MCVFPARWEKLVAFDSNSRNYRRSYTQQLKLIHYNQCTYDNEFNVTYSVVVVFLCASLASSLRMRIYTNVPIFLLLKLKKKLIVKIANKKSTSKLLIIAVLSHTWRTNDPPPT